jgi:transposase
MTLNPVPAARANARQRTCQCGCRERVPFYPSDLTDEQWAVLEPLLPVMLCNTVLGGRPERHWRRTMIDAMFYLADSGCKWRSLPRDFPAWKTVHAMLARWKRDGVWADITDLLRPAVRRAAGRHPEPSAAVIDSQSVHESAEGVVPAATSGFDRAGRRSTAASGTCSWAPWACSSRPLSPRPAPPTGTSRRCCWPGPAAAAVPASPWPGPTTATTAPARTGQPASSASRSRSSTAMPWEAGRKGNGFQVLPRRWVVERTLCAARRFAVFLVQPGGIRREVPGSNGLPGSERLRGQQHARKPGGRV